jgi:hypothetical protein
VILGVPNGGEGEKGLRRHGKSWTRGNGNGWNAASLTRRCASALAKVKKTAVPL